MFIEKETDMTVFNPIRAAIRNMVREENIRRDISRLEAMADRDLRDIGIARGEIHAMVRYGYRT